MKLWKIMLAALICVLMLSVVASAEHEHQWSPAYPQQVSAIYTKGTSEIHYAEFKDVRECVCGEKDYSATYEMELNDGGCDFKDGISVAATCEDPAYTEKICKVCGYTKKVETGSAKGHAPYVIKFQPQTCYSGKYYQNGCLNCDYTWIEYDKNASSYLPHNYTEGDEGKVKVQDATCKEPARYAYVCTMCGEYKRGETFVWKKDNQPDPNAHNWVEKKTPATCTTQGGVIKDCSLCGAHTEEVLGKLGHHPDYSTEVVTKATCTADGYKTAKCHVCGETFTYDKGEGALAKGHTARYPVAYTPAKCNMPGNLAYEICYACGLMWDTDGDPIASVPVIPANEQHKFGQTNVNYHYTDCDSATNYREGTCEYCGKWFVEYLPASEHKWPKATNANANANKAATCTKDGVGTIECEKCGEIKNDAVIPALGHKWYDWAYGEPADCITDMVASRTCMNDASHVEWKVVVPALGHTWVEINGTDATCTTPGKVDRQCVVCDKTEYGKVIAALGHNMTKVVKTVDPTCTEKGYTVYTCATCGTGEEKGAYTEATGHQNYEVTATVAPKCGVAGSVTKACADCGKTVTETVAALSHEYSWIVVSKPSEAGNGRNEYKCGKCGDVAEVKTIKYSKYYYNNTMTSFGPTTKELVGGNDWYRVTPVDVTVDGVYTYDLIASNKYVVGTVTISVNAGTLTVSYKVKGNVDVKDESLLIYASKADLAAGSAVTAPVGAAINVAETFGADGKVLVSLILTGDYDAAGKDLVNDAAAAGMIANID